MRLLAPLLVLVIALSGQLSAQSNLDPITTVGTIPDKTIKATLGSGPIDLRSYFAVPSITGQVVQFTVPTVGSFNVEMNSAVAPNTVANFLAYVNANRFSGTLIHRSNPGYRIIQGGGYYPNTTGTNFTNYGNVVKNPVLAMEAGDTMPHSRGTIAMARVAGDLNSATSEWFINTQDNTSEWLPASALNNSSYAAFGRVTGTGMTAVVDAIANVPVLGGKVTVITSSTTNTSVTVDASTVPPNFGPGWDLLGGQVLSFIGNFVTLNRNANATLTTPTAVDSSLYAGTVFDELPVLHNLASTAGPVPLTELVKTTTVTVVPLFPTSPTSGSVATFSAASSNPGLVKTTIRGSDLIITAGKNLSGSAQVTITATDSNGNSISQTAFNVTVQRTVADFNRDGNTDFLCQNNVGQIVGWYMDGAGSRSSWSYISTGPLGDWKVVGKGDFNNDGNTDILCQNNIGQIIVWYMDGAGVRTSWAYISTGALGDWRVVGTGDFNNDGNTDIICQNNIGQITVWYMNGAGVRTSWSYISSGPLGDWRVVGTGDFNNDGNVDILCQNSIGQITAWYMDGTGVRTSWSYISTGALADWRVVATGDFNNDGNTDILCQNGVGQITAWYMNGAGTRSSWAWISTGPLGDWRVR